MRIAFFGSPEFAVPSLQALQQRHQVVLVVAQPDKPAGRGMRRRAPAVVQEAKRLGLPVAQPSRLKNNTAFLETLRRADAEVAITAAYGKILPKAVLDVPPHGFLNVHASLLPKYRGAAPIQWALIEGEKETGITIMQTDVGLDTGPIRHVRKIAIGPDDTAADLFPRLAQLGAETLLEALELLERGELPLTPQDDSAASYAPMLTKADGRIDWQAPASAIYNRYRGLVLWPGSSFTVGDREIRAVAMKPAAGHGEPGTILEIDADGVVVAAGDGAIRLLQVKPPGRQAMAARDWANGYRLKVGDRLA